MATAQITRNDSSMMVNDNTYHQKMLALPSTLEQEAQKIEQMFWLDTAKLKQITSHFANELRFGLQDETGSRIPMNVTWVLGFPSGQEKGSFMTIDLGGSNLRVCWVTLDGNRGIESVKQHKYHCGTNEKLKNGTADELWNWVADCLHAFVEEMKLVGTPEKPLPLSFCFSYPATQHYIDHGILQRWTKGFNVSGCEGEDAAQQLRVAMERKGLHIHLISLINDTTGAMMATAYKDSNVIIGGIFGTGCNAAYVETCGAIPKLQKGLLPDDREMAINCEYGAFDNELKVLPVTPYDATIDKESPRPGQQRFEKLSAGLYLGEILRLILLDLHSRGLILKDQDVSKLQKAYAMDTSVLSDIENDQSPNLVNTQQALQQTYGVKLSDEEMEFMRRAAVAIAVRGSRLCACGVSAICTKRGLTHGAVAADGSVAEKHPKFRARWSHALAEILDWPENRTEDPVTMTSAVDGSGIGAAVIAAMTLERAARGETAGLRDV